MKTTIFHFPGANLSKVAVLAAVLLVTCASPITAKVTSFHQWPADASGATFSFIRSVDVLNDLEQQAYESKVQAELERLGFKRAITGQTARIQVDVSTGNGTRNKQFREAVYRDNNVYRLPIETQLVICMAAFRHQTRLASVMQESAL